MSHLFRRFAPTCLAVSLLADSAAAQCPPAACPATHVYLDFESLAAGTPVEGLGAVHPLLDITTSAWPFGPACPAGSARAIEEGVPAPAAYGTAGSYPNGCLSGVRGFGDDSGCVLDYDFTFAPGVTVSCFSFRMLDFGDLYPFGTAAHVVDVVAYDAASNVVDTDQLATFGPVDAAGGDACTAGPNASGNRLFTVTGPGIVRVTLRFDASPDPNAGFDDLSFCAHLGATSAPAPGWGAIKLLYR